VLKEQARDGAVLCSNSISIQRRLRKSGKPRQRRVKFPVVTNDNNSNDDGDLFRQMMSDVKPLSAKKSTEKVTPAKPRPQPKHQPAPPTKHASGFALREHVPEVAPEETLFFARSGLQTRLLRQLKRGDLRPEARLDLHGQTLTEAGARLTDFLNMSQTSGCRCVCIVHGKGHRSADGRPVLKAQINQWLRDTPAVLAFSSTLPRDGGTGAVYVLLRRR
jgi:DNA-nicking Smr family endonuclease